MPTRVNIEGVGTVAFEDGMTDEEIQSAIENDILPGIAREQQSAAMNEEFEQQAAQNLERGAAESALIGAGRGMMDTARGVQQLGAEVREHPVLKWTPVGMAMQAGQAMFGGPSAAELTAAEDEERQFYESTPVGQSTAGAVGRFGGQVAPTMAVPAAPFGGILSRALGEAGIGMLLGGASYVPEGGSRMAQAVGGGIGGGAGSLAMQAVTRPISKAINTGRAPVDDIDRAAELSNIQARAAGEPEIPVFAADTSEKPLVRRLSAYMEQVPIIGSSNARRAQNVAAQRAAERRAEGLMDDAIGARYAGLDDIQSAAASGGPRSKQATALLTEIEDAGDDWHRIIKASGNVALFQRRLKADELYNALEQSAARFGLVEKGNTDKVFGEVLAEVRAEGWPTTGLETKLTELRDAVLPAELDYAGMRQVRGRLRGMIDDIYTGKNSLLGTEDVPYIARLQRGVEKDMDEFARGRSELHGLWKDADRYYRKEVAPYRDTALAKALAGDDADVIYGKFIKNGPGQRGRAQKFYNALDDKGRAAVRYGILNDALMKGMGTDDVFSPKRFSTQLRKAREASDVFFSGGDRVELEGFRNLMLAIEQSGQVMANPMTGARNVPLGITAGATGLAMTSPPMFIMGVAGTLAARALLTTNQGRHYLRASSRYRPDSRRMRSVLEQVYTLLQRSAQQAGEATATQE